MTSISFPPDQSQRRRSGCMGKELVSVSPCFAHPAGRSLFFEVLVLAFCLGQRLSSLGLRLFSAQVRPGTASQSVSGWSLVARASPLAAAQLPSMTV